MEKYKILIKKSAVKELEAIPKRDLQKIVKRINDLSKDPLPQGVQKLSHQEKYRVRQGNYRIVYSIEKKELVIYIIKVGHRKDIYRQMK